MTTIENTLKKLSMLYEFNKKLRAFTASARESQVIQATESTVAAGRRLNPDTK